VTAVVGRRSRIVFSPAAGMALLAGLGPRFGIFDAGQESGRDPKYTVVPQRERLEARNKQERNTFADVH